MLRPLVVFFDSPMVSMDSTLVSGLFQGTTRATPHATGPVVLPIFASVSDTDDQWSNAGIGPLLAPECAECPHTHNVMHVPS